MAAQGVRLLSVGYKTRLSDWGGYKTRLSDWGLVSDSGTMACLELLW